MSQLSLVPGFYDKSLLPDLASRMGMRPAAYVDIDCDLYGSTKSALEWMLASRLIVPGTLIGYDDWWTTSCAVYHSSDAVRGLRGDAASVSSRKVRKDAAAIAMVGEWKAHSEMAAKFNVRLVCVAGPCREDPGALKRCDVFNYVAPVFLVTHVGGAGARADDGMGAFSDPALMQRMMEWPMCRTLGTKHG